MGVGSDPSELPRLSNQNLEIPVTAICRLQLICMYLQCCAEFSLTAVKEI